MLDFVGYDAPTSFLGEDPGLFAVMEGRQGQSSPGTLRRITLDLASRRVRAEEISGDNHEFPGVHPDRAGRAHRFAHLARGARDALFWSSLVRVDLESGREDVFDFGPTRICTEPVMAPRPGAGEEEGWLLSEVLDAPSGRSFLAILRSDALADGPVAEVWLPHHLPLSFHGSWLAA